MQGAETSVQSAIVLYDRDFRVKFEFKEDEIRAHHRCLLLTLKRSGQI